MNRPTKFLEALWFAGALALTVPVAVFCDEWPAVLGFWHGYRFAVNAGEVDYGPRALAWLVLSNEPGDGY